MYLLELVPHLLLLQQLLAARPLLLARLEILL